MMAFKNTTTWNLSLRNGTSEKLDAFCRDNRIKRTVMARLIDFFVAQPEFIQRAIADEVRGMELHPYVALLRLLADRLESESAPAACELDRAIEQAKTWLAGPNDEVVEQQTT